MLASILSLLISLKPVIIPILTALVGWLIPSPFQAAERGQASTHAAEDKADASRGDMGDLDRLP